MYLDQVCQNYSASPRYLSTCYPCMEGGEGSTVQSERVLLCCSNSSVSFYLFSHSSGSQPFYTSGPEKRQTIFKDRQHTIAMNGPDYRIHFVKQSYGFISRILILRK